MNKDVFLTETSITVRKLSWAKQELRIIDFKLGNIMLINRMSTGAIACLKKDFVLYSQTTIVQCLEKSTRHM